MHGWRWVIYCAKILCIVHISCCVMYGMNILKCFSYPGHSKQFTTTRGTSTMVRCDVGEGI